MFVVQSYNCNKREHMVWRTCSCHWSVFLLFVNSSTLAVLNIKEACSTLPSYVLWEYSASPMPVQLAVFSVFWRTPWHHPSMIICELMFLVITSCFVLYLCCKYHHLTWYQMFLFWVYHSPLPTGLSTSWCPDFVMFLLCPRYPAQL